VRFIDSPPFGFRQDATEWAGLTQACGAIGTLDQDGQHLFEGAVEDLLPLGESRQWAVSRGLPPAQVRTRLVQQFGDSLDLPRDKLMQSETARVETDMVAARPFHAAKSSRKTSAVSRIEPKVFEGKDAAGAACMAGGLSVRSAEEDQLEIPAFLRRQSS
jgi:cell division protein FtsZ